MIYGLHTAFDDFVSWVKQHHSSARMEYFRIEINGAMAKQINELLTVVIPRDNQHSVDGYSLCGVKVTIHKYFGRPIMPPEPPLILFNYSGTGFHGFLCTLDENGKVVSATDRVKCVEYPKIPVPKVIVTDGHVFFDYNIDYSEFDRKMKEIDELYEKAYGEE